MEGAVAYAVLLSTLTVLASCHQVCFIGSEYDPRSGRPPRWFLPYKDPCECTAIRLGGMNIPAPAYLKGAPYYLDGLFISEDAEEIQSTFDCQTVQSAVECSDPEPLGLEDRTIPDERMTASSGWSDRLGTFPAKGGRLNNLNSYWTPWPYSGSWIQVELGEPTLVSGVITQGASDGYDWRVLKYKVTFKRDHSFTLEHVIDANGAIQVFDGNVDDATTPVTNMFDQSIKAVVVRVEPVAWNKGVAMRLELLGCYITRME